jgi:1A family penicillin-binding protein
MKWIPPSKIGRVILALGIAAVVALLFFGFAWRSCFFQGCPDVATLASFQPGGAPVLLDREGEVFAVLTPVEQEIVPLHRLPFHVPQAFLAVEDRRFYEHDGIDSRRVAGAVVANLRAGGLEQGFSTITMQVARNVFPDTLPGQERSLARKLTEVRVAQDIEKRYSKQEILELYLNHIYFGNRAHGVEAAARQYFGAPAESLTLPQAALLAALPKAPTHYDPREHPEKARERRDLVLTLMERQGRIPRSEAEEAREAPLGVVPPPRQERVESGLAPYFVEQVRRELEERFGPGLYSRPLRILTTLDSRLQRAAEEELSRQLRRIERGALGRFEGPAYSSAAEPPPEGTRYLQGAVVALDAREGDVLAWVGGRNFAHSQFDRAASARRQAGSAFKPFVYAAALREGWVLSQPLVDRPLTVRLANGQIWRPRNFTGEYEERVTVREALVRSKNVATVRLASAVGLGQVAAAARGAGIEGRLPPVPAMALGTVVVSPLELTAAYTAFAALGPVVEPRWILAVEDDEGREVWRSSPSRREALPPRVAYLVTDVLSEALERGTGFRARNRGVQVPAAGKTGTTNDGTDAWFVGYTPEMAAGVWVGFDQPRPIAEDASGGRVAAPVWAEIVRRYSQERTPPEPWAPPAGLVERTVEPSSGLVLAEGCRPASGEPYRELFLEELVPAAWCPGREPLPASGFPVQVEAVRRQAVEAETRRLAEERARQEGERAERERLARELEGELDEEQQAWIERELEEERLARQEESFVESDRLAEEELRRAEERAREREPEEAEPDDAGEEDAGEADPGVVPDIEVRIERADAEPEPAEEPAGPAAVDLSGWWEFNNQVEQASYQPFVGLRLGYRIQLEQEGGRITGRGQKWSENGRTLPASARTPITLTGTVEGGQVTLHFTEQGTQRASGGRFDLRLSADRTALSGGFRSGAADTRGITFAGRMR